MSYQTSEFRPSTASAPETISSVLADLQDCANNLFKAASRLDAQADNLLGAAPQGQGGPPSDMPAAQTVLQKLRDLRRQFREAHDLFYATGTRLESQF